MKILHKSKRASPPHPQVAELILKLLNTSADDLAEVLAQIDSWKWPRSDLNVWIKVLNKFDAVLEEAIRDYDVDKLQINIFTPATKTTICEILRFERLLLENSTNRKVFNSYDRLNSLLFTSDLDVLILALHLLLRPAQQYSAQPALSHALNISTPRLQSLVKRWPNLREYGVNLLDLSSPKGISQLEGVPADAHQVNFSYYKTDSKAKEQKHEGDVFDSSPRKQPSATANNQVGATTIRIDEEVLMSKDVMNVLADIVEVHTLSDDDRFELLCRMRCAAALDAAKQDEREKLIIARLLAIAIFGHTHSEAQAASLLFLYEPDLVTHVAELLQLDRGVPIPIQTAALAALDALARYRNKIQEVLTAVNAGVNHGILMALVRKTVADVGQLGCQLPHSFVDALLSFVTFIASHAAGGNMVVGAGLVPLLIQIIENRLAQRLSMVSKTMQLVDNVLYGFTNAFQLFCNARGVEVVIDRIQYEIDFDLHMYGSESRSREVLSSYGELPVARTAVLKHTLRSMHRMMQSSGTAEGLRGLIDSSLLQSVKKIIQNRGLFGPSILPIALNIMATFVHNEPTSLSIIQEAGLPEAFYKAIETGLEPVIEVIQAIPNAIGALCLNQNGQDQLAARPSIIPAIFSIFTSERHLKVLQDKENAALIGTAIDELIRHHPLLKSPVFEALKSSLSRVEELGNAWTAPQALKEWYGLLPAGEVIKDGADAMEGVETEGIRQMTAEVLTDTPDEFANMPDGDERLPGTHDNPVVSFIDVLCRFLEGLFQHTPHCKDFIRNADGLERLGRLTALPCLPYDFANSVASDSLVQVLRTMAEVGANEVLLYLSKLVGNSLAETQRFWVSLESQSRLLPFADPSDDLINGNNQEFRTLTTLHIRISLMADVFSSAGYSHGRAAIGLLQTLMGEPPKLVIDLGALHRAFVWENILMKAGLVSKGLNVPSSSQASPLERSPSQTSLFLPDPTNNITINGFQSESGDAALTPLRSSEKLSPIEKNAKALKHLTHGIPSALAPFFQSIVKLFYARRNPDQTQKKQIMASSSIITSVMLQHLQQEVDGDLVHCLAYRSVMLGLITILLVDERTAQHALHTVLLLAFYRAGGLDAVFHICRSFISTIDRLATTKEEERSDHAKQELVHAYGGLQVALHLLHPLISSKPLFDSGQTVLVLTRDKKDTDSDYFEPHDFLVQLRLSSVAFLRELWEASWLVSSPLALIKSVVQCVLELTGGESEELKGDSVNEVVLGGPGPAGNSMARARSPDESRIRQLTDMGFPRSAAERALIRTHNNVNAATELLLSHPLPLPADPEPTESSGADVPGDTDDIMSHDDIPQGSASIDSAHEEIGPLQLHSATSDRKSAEELRKELSAARDPLKVQVSRKALRLLDEHPGLIFDVHRAFLRPSDDVQDQAIRDLVEDIKAFSPAAYDVQEEPLAVRCRLLALVLSEAPSLPQGVGSEFVDCLVALLLSDTISLEADHRNIPKWLAAHLLVTEAVLSMSNQPSATTMPKADEDIRAKEICSGPTYPKARLIVFDFCLRLLAVHHLPRDELLSTLRLLVFLTRDHDIARQLVKRNGVALLFEHLKGPSTSGSHSYIAIILRHIAEEASVLHHIMEQEVKRFFSSQPRTRIVDVANYVRHCSGLALRDPNAFIRATESLCQLQQPSAAVHHITLRNESRDNPNVTDDVKMLSIAESQGDLNHVGGNVSPSLEAMEGTVHFLISELMKSTRISLDPASEFNSAQGPKSPKSEIPPDAMDTSVGPQDTAANTDNSEERQRNPYSCLLMQCLTELLFSYDSCKSAFLSFSSKKRPLTPAKDGGNKHRAAALHYLLSDLVTFGTINPRSDNASRDRFALCNWAMTVIVALCVDTSVGSEAKEAPADLVNVRKLVLEAVSRAIRDVSLTESLDGRYGRLLALADLCNRLLTMRLNDGVRKPHDDSPTYVAKIMLEKNYVTALTNALAEVDLNYPNVRGLVASILRPLENLTRIAIKMSRASDKGKENDEGKPDSVDSASEEDSDEDMGEADREETPDLYRNSSLGMFAGEMEDIHYSPEDDMDEGEDDEDEDVEMEFGDETGSDATSNTDEEEAHDMEDENSHDDEEGWQDEDEEYEEDGLVANEEDNEDSDPDAEDEADAEIMWQDVHDEENAPEEAEEEADEEEDVGDPISIIHSEQEDEPDMLSDEDDFQDEGRVINHRSMQPTVDQLFNFGDAFINDGQDSGGRDLHNPFFVSRRTRTIAGDDMQVFGRPRNVPAAPPEATTHPLLLDAPSPPSRPSAGQPRGSRRPHRVVGSGNIHNDLIQTIENIIGEGAVQLFHDLFTRRAGDAAETIHLDVPSGTLMNVGRGVLHRRAPGVMAATVRVERAPRSQDTRADAHGLDPLLTSQRWAEEAKILNGKFVNSRADKICNHVIAALLPAAVKANQLKEEQNRQAQARTQDQIATEQPPAVPADSPAIGEDAQPGEDATGHMGVESNSQETIEHRELNPGEDTPIATNENEDVDMAEESAEIAQNVSSTEAESDSALNPGNPTNDVIEEGPSAPAPGRVTVMIHGSAVDITEMGIDPLFLEALPDDIREEVINQHVRDQRAARVERPPDSQISPEFLDALPPEIRAELIQQERVEQARRANDSAPSGEPAGIPADMDPASFIASLDPQLRQVVLLDSDDGFIQTLPSYMIAEAGVYRDESQIGHRHISTRPAARSALQRSIPNRKLPPPRDAIQLLDKAGVATLVRLLFFPQVSKKNLLFKVLVNICENGKTRAELFNLLLAILQSGSGDLSAVDKNFGHSSTRPPKPSSHATPKAAGKQKAGSDSVPSTVISNIQTETLPDLIAQRCLEALTYIVSSNEVSSLFFLTEHELPAALRKSSSKKGKGKEKQVSQTHYPLVLLLGLLDRQFLLKTPSITESVVSLLSTVTRPLTSLQQQSTKTTETSAPADAAGSIASEPPLPQQSSVPPSSSVQAVQTATSTTQDEQSKGQEPPDDKVTLAHPPQIPHPVLRLIVNILTVGECSGRTFQQSLALIQHLSCIPDGRDVIAQELHSKAQEFGQSIYSDLNELAIALQDSDDNVLASSVASRFSSASSDQAKLLRVLKTIDYMYSTRTASEDETRQSKDAEKVQSIYESFRFAPLWRRLGDCLGAIEEKPENEHIATVLLPLIEALMVVCKYVGPKSSSGAASRAVRFSASPKSPTAQESMEDLFVSFTDAHRKMLNLMVRNNPSLMSGSFSLLVHNPRVLDFDNKRNYFGQQLHRRPHSREHHVTLQLNVRRARVFEDSFQYLQRKTGDQIKYGKLSVRFYDEEGVDAGGVTREWFQILARQMFDPNNALFQPCAADRLTYQPNKNSWVNPEHLSFFKFVGRVIGKAIYDGRLLDAYFAKSIYRQLLGKQVDYRDVEWVDPEYYNSLCWILENDPTPLELTFSVEADEFGRNRIFPLKEGGESIPVTQENKREFVQLSANFRLYSSISEQIEHLVAGFYEIIPKDLITIFNEQELELLISGTPDIDVDEWRAATEYNGYSSSDPVIVWWWRALKSFNREERAKVLSFATGTSRVPLGGFSDLQGVQGVQKFSIHRAYGDSDRLPQAHTCFNQIDLPQYSSYEMLRHQLLLAINEGGEGFGFA